MDTGVNRSLYSILGDRPEYVSSPQDMQRWLEANKEKEALTKSLANMAVDFYPGVGDVKSLTEAIAGKNALGQDLGWLERGLNLVGVLPFIPPLGTTYSNVVRNLTSSRAQAAHMIPEIIAKAKTTAGAKNVPSLYEASEAFKSRLLPEIREAQRGMGVVPERIFTPVSDVTVSPAAIVDRTLRPGVRGYQGQWWNPSPKQLGLNVPIDIPSKIQVIGIDRPSGLPDPTLLEVLLHEFGHEELMGNLYRDPSLYAYVSRLRRTPEFKTIGEYGADAAAMNWLNAAGVTPSGYLTPQILLGRHPELSSPVLNQLSLDYPSGITSPQQLREALGMFVQPGMNNVLTDALNKVLRYMKVP